MRRFISCCIISIILINTPVNARAAVPLPAVAGGVMAISLATGAYIYYRSGSSSTVSPAFVSRAADAAWYARYFGGLLLVTKPITLRTPTNSVMDVAKNNPTDYPLLNAATSVQGGFNTSDLSQPLTGIGIGSIVTNSLGTFQLTSYSSSTTCMPAYYSSMHDTGYPTATSDRIYIKSSTRGSCGSNWEFRLHLMSYTPTTPILTPATPAQFQQNIAPSGTVANTSLQAELDRMFADPSYVPEFTDDTTGLPWAPPADVVRPEKWTEIQERAKAISAAQSAVDAARTAVNELQNRHNAAVAAANADPTNPEKQRALSDLAIALGIAQARLAELEQQLATLIADAEAYTDDPDPPVDPGDVPTLKPINWSYGTKLLGSLETAWPFNLLLSLRGMLSPLEASPVAPSFSLPIWGGNNISLSLSVFDPVALVLRWSLSLLLTVGVVMAVVRWYRGGS